MSVLAIPNTGGFVSRIQERPIQVRERGRINGKRKAKVVTKRNYVRSRRRMKKVDMWCFSWAVSSVHGTRGRKGIQLPGAFWHEPGSRSFRTR